MGMQSGPPLGNIVAFSSLSSSDTSKQQQNLEQVLGQLEQLPVGLKGIERLAIASKLIEDAAFDLVRDMPGLEVSPLISLAAQIERQAHLIIECQL